MKKSRRARPGVVGAASHMTARVSAWGMPEHMGLPHCECESGPEFAARGRGGQASLLSTWPECACGAEVPLLSSSDSRLSDTFGKKWLNNSKRQGVSWKN